MGRQQAGNDKIVPVRRKEKKPASGKVKVLLVLCILLLIGMTAVIINQCSIEEIIVNGNETYTKDEVEAAVRSNCVDNTVFYTVLAFFGDNAYLPFIDEINVTFLGKNKILVEVEEKMRAGMIQEMSQYFYFDKDGVLLESTDARIKDVPIVTGLQMNSCVVGEKVEPKEENVFPIILKMAQLIIKYEIPVSEIQFNTMADIRLKCSSIQVCLGDASAIDAQMAELPAVLDSLYGRKGELNMRLFDGDKGAITFKPN
jgi:cell division protein FtsQ